jgi:hypothetical protein
MRQSQESSIVLSEWLKKRALEIEDMTLGQIFRAVTEDKTLTFPYSSDQIRRTILASKLTYKFRTAQKPPSQQTTLEYKVAALAQQVRYISQRLSFSLSDDFHRLFPNQKNLPGMD